MLENLNDYLSFIVLLLFVGLSIYLIYAVSNRNHESIFKRREEIYLSYLEDAEDDFDDSHGEDSDEY